MNRFIILLFILIFLLSLRFFFFFSNTTSYHDGEEVSFTHTFLEEPRIIGRYQVATVYGANGQRLQVYFPRYPELQYGQTVRISGIVNSRVISSKSIVFTVFSKKIEIEKNNGVLEGFAIRIPLAISSFFRQNIKNIFQKTLGEPSASLLIGIVFGIKENMPKGFSDALVNTGVVHVVAASGMNVTLLIGFLVSMFGNFLKRRVALIACLVGIVFYALVAGFSASIVRASIMGSLLCVAQILGRQYLAQYGLILTGIVMLFVNPSFILDVGFQLSFAATGGLLLLPPLVENEKLKKLTVSFPVTQDITTTIIAQLATLPILLSNFGTYSLWSVLVNALVLWTIPFLMVIGSISVFIGMIIPWVGQLVLYLALPLLWYFETIVTFSNKQGGIVAIKTFPWQFVVAYYIFLLAMVVFVKKRKLLG